MQAMMKAGCDVPPDVLESIFAAQNKLPAGAAPLSPQALMQAVTADQNAKSQQANNAVLQAAIKAQADAAKSVTPAVLEAVLRAQQSLPAGAANDPQALLQAIAKAGGSIPPAVLAAVLNAQKNLPAGTSQNPQALLQSVQKMHESLTNCSPHQLPASVLQSVLQTLPPSAQLSAMAGLSQQQNGNGSQFNLPSLSPAALASLIQSHNAGQSLPPAALAAILQAQSNSPSGGSNLSNLPPAALAALSQLQRNNPGIDLSSLPPATLAAMVQSQSNGLDLSGLPPASMAALLQSAGGAGLTSEQKSSIPPHILEAVSRMSKEDLEKYLGIYERTNKNPEFETRRMKTRIRRLDFLHIY
jgi:hypothetical protein